MEPWVEMIIAIFVATLGSSGLWVLIQRRVDKKDYKTKLLLGLAHDRIVYLCLHYLERKNISKAEYKSLYDYLFVPYEKLDGDGSAALLMSKVKDLDVVGGEY